MALAPVAAKAMPFDSRVAGAPDVLIEKAQVVVAGPRRARPRQTPLGLLVAQGSAGLRLAVGVNRTLMTASTRWRSVNSTN